MSATFWTNTIWYVLLGILTLFELIFVMVKAERRKLTFAFYLTILGITLNFEMIILIFMKAYAYYPMILKNPPLPFDDVLSGNLFSQFSVAATVLLVTVLDLKYYWFFIFAGIYGIIEELFLTLGIYSQNWYRTWMTVVLLSAAFWIAKKMYAKMIRGIKPIFYYGYIYLALFPLNIVILEWGVFILCRLQDFNTILFPDPLSSRHFLALVNFWMLSIPIMLLYFLRLKWSWKALVIITIYAIYYLGYKLNLFIIKDGWFLPVSTLSIFWMYLSIVLLDRLYGGPQKKY